MEESIPTPLQIQKVLGHVVHIQRFVQRNLRPDLYPKDQTPIFSELYSYIKDLSIMNPEWAASVVQSIMPPPIYVHTFKNSPNSFYWNYRSFKSVREFGIHVYWPDFTYAGFGEVKRDQKIATFVNTSGHKTTWMHYQLLSEKYNALVLENPDKLLFKNAVNAVNSSISEFLSRVNRSLTPIQISQAFGLLNHSILFIPNTKLKARLLRKVSPPIELLKAFILQKDISDGLLRDIDANVVKGIYVYRRKGQSYKFYGFGEFHQFTNHVLFTNTIGETRFSKAIEISLPHNVVVVDRY